MAVTGPGFPGPVTNIRIF